MPRIKLPDLWFQRQESKERESIERYGLDRCQVNALARYNSESARGIVHTEAWKEKMARYQKIFDENIRCQE